MAKKIFIVLMLIYFGIITSKAQNIEITGRVVEYTNVTKPPVGKKSFDIESVSGVSVTQEGTTNSTLTDVDGNFKITAPANAVLVFQYKGYKKRSIKVNWQTKLFVVLKRKRG